MPELSVTTLHDTKATIDGEAVDAFAATLRGALITPDSPGYEEARSIWNAMIDRRPGMIVRCAGAADVISAVRFARKHDLLMSIKGAGHNIAGNAVSDGAMMIDLSHMKSVHVDPASKTARVEPGCTLKDFDHEAQAFGLAAPTGINSTTGISGLTLGGGFGWLSRSLGLTVDSLLSVDLVTAEGEMVRTSAKDHSDLFWAVRGGGGNFGIVTSFEFRLHEVGPQVLAGLIVHPFDDVRPLLEYYRDFAADASDDLTIWVVLRKAPPLPFLPEEWHGREVAVVATMYAGSDMAEGEKQLAELRAFGNPIADVIGPAPYAGWQQAFDPLLTPGARNYWKSHDFTNLDDGLLDVLIDGAANLPGPECEIFIAQLGGETSRVPVDATAYPHREAEYLVNVHTRWQEPADDDAFVAWARALFDGMAPFATGGVYVNFMPSDETARVLNAYGRNWDRLAKIKQKYDPNNVFRVNQNISVPA